MVPKELADQWSVTPYLSWKKDATKGRVKCVRLRGATSYGFLAPNDTNAEIDTNLAEMLGIEKYEEPIPIGMQAGQQARNHPFFHTYTDIQNLRNYPDKLDYSLPLVVTEKLHGTNSRVGWVASNTDAGDVVLERVVGSHRTQRKRRSRESMVCLSRCMAKPYTMHCTYHGHRECCPISSSSSLAKSSDLASKTWLRKEGASFR
jgi:hypothetical protein